MENEIISDIKRTFTTKQFNMCRMFTRVLYLSEICNATGNELDPKLNKYSTPIRNSRLTWPTQLKPAETFRKEWI